VVEKSALSVVCTWCFAQC